MANVKISGFACPIKSLTGLECPGCGITRSISALVEGQLADAADHNLLTTAGILLVLSTLILIIVNRPLRGSVKNLVARPPTSLIVGIGFVLSLFTAVRNTDFVIGRWLASGLY